ncbi:hypothetical protein CRG98_045507, partial [Punica granatum]
TCKAIRSEETWQARQGKGLQISSAATGTLPRRAEEEPPRHCYVSAIRGPFKSLCSHPQLQPRRPACSSSGQHVVLHAKQSASSLSPNRHFPLLLISVLTLGQPSFALFFT